MLLHLKVTEPGISSKIYNSRIIAKTSAGLQEIITILQWIFIKAYKRLIQNITLMISMQI